MPSSEELVGTPPTIVHSTPVPAQIMHSSAPRRLTPFVSSSATFVSCPVRYTAATSGETLRGSRKFLMESVRSRGSGRPADQQLVIVHPSRRIGRINPQTRREGCSSSVRMTSKTAQHVIPSWLHEMMLDP